MTTFKLTLRLIVSDQSTNFNLALAYFSPNQHETRYVKFKTDTLIMSH